jgi:hypothetical protein
MAPAIIRPATTMARAMKEVERSIEGGFLGVSSFQSSAKPLIVGIGRSTLYFLDAIFGASLNLESVQ